MNAHGHFRSNAHADASTILTKRALTSVTVVMALLLVAASSAAVGAGSLAKVELVARGESRVLPSAWSQGRHWVVGTPGQEYAVRVCNATGARLLAVTSVDGVNVITGDTAAPGQSGYVLDPHGCLDIAGWRKSMARTAAFYFTELPDSYAARTGRPDNLGVIGVALFREKLPPPVAWQPMGKVAADARREMPAAASAEASSTVRDEAKRQRDDVGSAAPLPRTMLGTGHGRSEYSRAQQVAFERESSEPAETVAIHYDRRENLVAMGILPPPVVAHARPPNPFPAWPQFVADPPRRH